MWEREVLLEVQFQEGYKIMRNDSEKRVPGKIVIGMGSVHDGKR